MFIIYITSTYKAILTFAHSHTHTHTHTGGGGVSALARRWPMIWTGAQRHTGLPSSCSGSGGCVCVLVCVCACVRVCELYVSAYVRRGACKVFLHAT